MTKEEISTQERLIDANIRLSEYNEMTFAARLELIILYLKINNETVKFIHHDEFEFILLHLLNNNYTLNENSITIEGREIDLNELEKIIKLVDAKKVQLNNYRCLGCRVVDDVKIYEMKTHRHEVEGMPKIDFTIPEQRDILLYNAETSRHTDEYVAETRKKFREGISNNILDLMSTGDIPNDKRDLILSLIQVYPLSYQASHGQVPYENIGLPYFQIGLRKTSYNDPKVKKVEADIETILKDYAILYQKYKEASEEEKNKYEQPLLKDRVAYFSKVLESYEIRHSNAIYTPNFLKYLEECIKFNGIEIVPTNDGYSSKLVLYYIKNDEVVFIAQMRLDTMKKLVDSRTLLELTQDQKKLKKEDIQ